MELRTKYLDFLRPENRNSCFYITRTDAQYDDLLYEHRVTRRMAYSEENDGAALFMTNQAKKVYDSLPDLLQCRVREQAESLKRHVEQCSSSSKKVHSTNVKQYNTEQNKVPSHTANIDIRVEAKPITPHHYEESIPTAVVISPAMSDLVRRSVDPLHIARQASSRKISDMQGSSTKQRAYKSIINEAYYDILHSMEESSNSTAWNLLKMRASKAYPYGKIAQFTGVPRLEVRKEINQLISSLSVSHRKELSIFANQLSDFLDSHSGSVCFDNADAYFTIGSTFLKILIMVVQPLLTENCKVSEGRLFRIAQ